MTDDEIRRKRIAKMLLEDVKTGKMEWYYVSIADEFSFYGGFLIEARGPTEAWTLLHRLGWYPYGSTCSTSTNGPISEKVMEKVPEGQRWRKLTEEEALNLGKG